MRGLSSTGTATTYSDTLLLSQLLDFFVNVSMPFSHRGVFLVPWWRVALVRDDDIVCYARANRGARVDCPGRCFVVVAAIERVQSGSVPRLLLCHAPLPLPSGVEPAAGLRLCRGDIGEGAREEGLEFVKKVSLGGLHARLLAQQPQVADDAHLLAYDGPRPRPQRWR
jgi:hypothetical protein